MFDKLLKIYNFLKIPEYKSTLTEAEKESRSCKILLLFLLSLGLFLFAEIPAYSQQTKKYDDKLEWVCSCGYNNYDEIGYCGICGAKKTSKRR